MSISELMLILILSVILLKPNEIESILKNIVFIIVKINKYIHEIKKNLFNF